MHSYSPIGTSTKQFSPTPNTFIAATVVLTDEVEKLEGMKSEQFTLGQTVLAEMLRVVSPTKTEY